MTRTFEVLPEGLGAAFASPSLAEATAALPAGAYTTLRTYGSRRIWRLPDHVRRLEGSSALQGSPAPLDAGLLARGMARALEECGLPEARLRVTFAPPRLFVSVEPFTEPPEADYREGVRCLSLPLQRENPLAKDTRFVATAQEAYRSLPPGIHEGLLVGADGILLEGLSSNFLAVRAGALWTEEGRVLPGLTRAVVLELAAALLPRGPRGVRRDELPGAQEAFLTSASRGVLPVVRVDEVAVGSGRPGPVARELRRRLDERVWGEAQPLPLS